MWFREKGWALNRVANYVFVDISNITVYIDVIKGKSGKDPGDGDEALDQWQVRRSHKL